jgi:hypothetical protein
VGAKLECLAIGVPVGGEKLAQNCAAFQQSVGNTSMMLNLNEIWTICARFKRRVEHRMIRQLSGSNNSPDTGHPDYLQPVSQYFTGKLSAFFRLNSCQRQTLLLELQGSDLSVRSAG